MTRRRLALLIAVTLSVGCSLRRIDTFADEWITFDIPSAWTVSRDGIEGEPPSGPAVQVVRYSLSGPWGVRAVLLSSTKREGLSRVDVESLVHDAIDRLGFRGTPVDAKVDTTRTIERELAGRTVEARVLELRVNAPGSIEHDILVQGGPIPFGAQGGVVLFILAPVSSEKELWLACDRILGTVRPTRTGPTSTPSDETGRTD